MAANLLRSVGIEEYLRSNHEGFYGLLKCRSEDFHVHEIDLSHSILHLEELITKSDVAQDVRQKKLVDSGEGIVSPDYVLCPEKRKQLLSEGYFTMDDTNTLEHFIRSLGSLKEHLLTKKDATSEEKDESLFSAQNPPHCLIEGDFQRCYTDHFSPVDEEKDETEECTQQRAWKVLRTKIHAAIRALFPFLASQTADRSQIEQRATLKENVEKSRENALSSLYVPGIPSPSPLWRVIPRAGVATNFIVAVYPKPLCCQTLGIHTRRRQDPHGGQESSRGRKKRKGKKGRQNDSSSVPNPLCSAPVNSTSNSLGKDFIFSNDERWPTDRPPYLHFRLWKFNRDTAEAVHMVAACVGVSVKAFSWAGTKDKKAITVQGVSVHKVSKERLRKAILHPRWDKNVRISNFSYRPHRLQLGHLQGNHFRICLRDVDPSSEQLVATACEELKMRGFVNYFGLQRFGTHAVKTHLIGAALLLRRWEKAVRLLLGDTTQMVHADQEGEKIEKSQDGPEQSRMTEEEECAELENNNISGMTEEEECAELENNNISGMTEEEECAELENNNISGMTEDAELENNNISRMEVDEENVNVLIDDTQPTLLFSPHSTKRTSFVGQIQPPADNCKLRQLHPPSSSVGRLPRRACDIYLQTGDAQLALHHLPRRLFLERTILTWLIREPRGFLPSLQHLPDNSLSLYLHAAQSAVWNYVASRRIREFGTRVVLGDLVVVKMRGQRETTDRENSLRPAELTDSPPRDEDESPTEVVEIRSAEVALRFSIFDVVLPSPGSAIFYPTFLPDVFEEAAQELLGVPLSSFQDLKQYGIGKLSGTYRHLCVKPTDLIYTFHPHVNRSRKMVLSDVDYHMQQKSELSSSIHQEKIPPIEGDDCESAAVTLSCSLPKSTYLTMAVRELLQP